MGCSRSQTTSFRSILSKVKEGYTYAQDVFGETADTDIIKRWDGLKEHLTRTATEQMIASLLATQGKEKYTEAQRESNIRRIRTWIGGAKEFRTISSVCTRSRLRLFASSPIA